jgi:hypothetical protein
MRNGSIEKEKDFERRNTSAERRRWRRSSPAANPRGSCRRRGLPSVAHRQRYAPPSEKAKLEDRPREREAAERAEAERSPRQKAGEIAAEKAAREAELSLPRVIADEGRKAKRDATPPAARKTKTSRKRPAVRARNYPRGVFSSRRSPTRRSGDTAVRCRRKPDTSAFRQEVRARPPARGGTTGVVGHVGRPAEPAPGRRVIAGVPIRPIDAPAKRPV